MSLFALNSRFAAAMMAGLVLVGCSSTSSKDSVAEEPENYLKPVEQEVDPVAPMVLRVVGYGAVDVNNKKQSAMQRRLMAVRAAKLDAYRALAERLYGMQVQGSTTVRDMVVQDDRFRTYVETYMHGARVLSADVLSDGTVETTLEMVVDQGFRNCLQTTDNKRINVDCRAPVVGVPNRTASKQRERVQAEAGIPETGFYFIE